MAILMAPYRPQFGRQINAQELKQLKAVVQDMPELGAFYAESLKAPCCSVAQVPGPLGRLLKAPFLWLERQTDHKRLLKAVQHYGVKNNPSALPILTMEWFQLKKPDTRYLPPFLHTQSPPLPIADTGIFSQGQNTYRWTLYQPDKKSVEQSIRRKQPALTQKPHKLPPTGLVGTALAQQFMPQHPETAALFEGFINLTAFEKNPKPHWGRFEEGLAAFNDVPFQTKVQSLVDQGVIGPGTLVFSNTGHDIPIAAQLFKNSQLHLQAVFHQPFDPAYDTENGLRVCSQAQTWGGEIEVGQRKGVQTIPKTLFVGLDLHRWDIIYGRDNYPVAAQALPNWEQLKAFGIRQVVCLLEEYETMDHRANGRLLGPEMRPYLEKLQADGAPVIFKGIETRQWF